MNQSRKITGATNEKKGLGRWIPIDFIGTDFSDLHFVDLINPG